MAEGLLNKLLRAKGLDHVLVESAGTHAPDGSPPTSAAIEAAAGLGADIRRYKASMLDRFCVVTADLVLVMEDSHRALIHASWPVESSGKIRMIRSFLSDAQANDEVPDPIGATLSEYRRIADLLQECCDGVVEWLEKDEEERRREPRMDTD